MEVLHQAARAGLLLLPDESLDTIARLDGSVLRYRSSAPEADLCAAVEAVLSGAALSYERPATPHRGPVPRARP